MSFPLDRFLNQTCTYQAFTGTDNRDDPTYAASVTVPCLFREVDREQYGRTEEQRGSQTKVFLLFEPVLRSLINGREVVKVEAMVQVSGNAPGWSAFLR